MGPSARTLPLEWSEDMAYVVGLMATDGCLIAGRKQLNFKSEDEQLVQTFLTCLGKGRRYRGVKTRTGNTVYVTQFSDARFYEWLMTVGLTPRKSLTLGVIDVPDAFALSLLRGLLDGDGSIQTFVHRPTASTYPDYQYERLWVFFTSASRSHIDWIQALVERLLGFRGYVEVRPGRPPHHDFFRLKFGKHSSIALLRAVYPMPDVPKLERKWLIWEGFRTRHELAEDEGPWVSGADGGTRTRMGLRPPPPEDGASTGWATSASTPF